MSLPEACRLSDALVGQLRDRLGAGPVPAPRSPTGSGDLRAQLERIRDQVGLEPAGARAAAGRRAPGQAGRAGCRTSPTRPAAAATSAACSARWRSRRPRFERDLIVGAARRREARDQVAPARELRADLEAREAALRDAGGRRCVATVDPAPALRRARRRRARPGARTPPTRSSAYLRRLDQVSPGADAGAGRAYAGGAAPSTPSWSPGSTPTSPRPRAPASPTSPTWSRAYALARDALDRAADPDGRGRASWSRCTRPSCSSEPRHAVRTPRSPHDRARSPAAPGRSSTATATSAACPGRRRRGAGAPRSPTAVDRRRPPAGPPAGRPTARCAQPGLHRHHRRRLLRRLRHARRRGPAAAAPPAGRVAGARRPALGSTMTRGSSRLGSTALGSQRAGASGSTATRRVRSGSQRLRSARLGAGLTRVPPAPPSTPRKAIMANPEVPEDKRICPSCGDAGRPRPRRPARPRRGLLPQVRQRSSPSPPSCKPGDLVAGQYEVAGCLAHGGLGWIYLARDRNVSDRWVVLKGLLNTGDADALAAAIAEQQFLAQVEHPLIVEIYNFVTHEGAGYIVMEYVGGTSLKQILKERMRANGGVYDPLPVDQALAYILEVLPAFQYLHDLGLVYCDFKPDNLIQVGDAVKLIDLGGVRRHRRRGVRDLRHGRLPGARGRRRSAPSVASDIYTIGRTLVVLMHGVPRLPDHVRRQRCRRSTSTPLFAAARLALPAARQGLRARPGRPVRLGRRAARPAARRAARGRRREDRPAPRSPRRPRCCSRRRRSPATRWPGTSCRRCGADTTDPQYAWLTNIAADDPEQRLAELRAGAGGRPPRCCWPGPGRRSSCGRPRPASTQSSTRCSPTTRGSGGRSG